MKSELKKLDREKWKQRCENYGEILAKLAMQSDLTVERRIYELGVQAGALLQRNDPQAREALKRNLEQARLLGVHVGHITGGDSA